MKQSQRKPNSPNQKKQNNVLLLKKSSFDGALKETKYLVVEFCEYQFPLSLNLMALQSMTDAGVLRYACFTVVAFSSSSPCLFDVSISNHNYSNLFLFGVVKYHSAM